MMVQCLVVQSLIMTPTSSGLALYLINTVYQLTMGLLFSLLQAKARNVEGMRDRMFSGDKINFTEVG